MKILLRILSGFCLALSVTGVSLSFVEIPPGPVSPVMAAPQTQLASQAAPPRRVNIPYFPGTVNESQSAIFWFGQNEWYQDIPGRNYVDVRLAYSPAGLYVRATVIDYYLWYKANAQISDDLTRYDALAIYLDTGHDRAATPQADDYYFLVGLHGDSGPDTPQYRRQAQGAGTGWDTTWSHNWSDYSGWQWSDRGPNDNSGNIDYGWVGGGTIPWSAFGLTGPPAENTVWGLGVLLYDQDQSSSSPVLQENWPETFQANQPATWGEVHFGLPHYTPHPAVGRHNTLIRAATPQDNTVEDAWMGGGGWCNSGHEGHTEENHGNDQQLFIGSEIQPTHFPCYNKSYLRFALNSLPAGKAILSATLTLHQWGGANVDAGTSSYVWLSSVMDPWQEMSIHWNNAPLAQENLSLTRIPPKTTPLVWPGDPYTWDATQAVAEAYQAGQPVSFAMYDSTTGRDSSKYLIASETGLGDGTPNWNIEGRPRLDIVWGDPAATLTKSAQPITPKHGDVITYTLKVVGPGQTLALTDTIPSALSHPFMQQATQGTLAYNPATRQLTWSGTPTAGEVVTITYAVTANVSSPLAVSNTAILTLPGSPASTATAWVCVECYPAWLPLIQR